MTDTSIPAAEAASEDAGPLPRRILETFLSPGALFRRFGAAPPWWDVLLISTVLGAIAFAFVPREVWVAMTEQAVAQNPQASGGMDVDQVAGFQRIFGIVAAALMPWIFALIQAGILTFVFSVLMGGGARFRQYLAVIAHASLIGALGQLASLPLILQKQDLRAGINLGALLPNGDPESFAYQFLTGLNVFMIWGLVVTGVGVAAINRKISVGTAVGVLLAIFLVIVGVVAAI